jgi:ketosteroid isomerase-like protein
VDHPATVQEIYEAFGRGDVPAILDRLTDDIAWDLDAPGYGVPPRTVGAEALGAAPTRGGFWRGEVKTCQSST